VTWPRDVLDSVADVRSGGTPLRSSAEYFGGQIPWAKIADLEASNGVVLDTEEHLTDEGLEAIGNRLFKPGTVLLAMYGSIGKVATAGRNLATNQAILGITSREPKKLRNDFIKYWLIANRVELERLGQGVTQKNLSAAIVRALKIPLPPELEQRRIVEILDEADRLRKLRAEADAKAERILPALFIKMLGDASAWTKNPRSVPLGNVARPLSGGTPSKAEPLFWQGSLPWVSPKDMKRPFISDSQDHLLPAAASALGIIPSESVLVVVRGMILAHSVPVALTGREVTINQDMKALLPTDNRVSARYLWAALRVAEREMLRRVGTAGHGTRKLDTDELLSIPIVVPSSAERIRVEGVVNWYQQSRDLREKSVDGLERIFNSLTQRAFQGELTGQSASRPQVR
jgi:type I restriction enzyme S subunit